MTGSPTLILLSAVVALCAGVAAVIVVLLLGQAVL
jgi:hypothetical protein